MGPNNKRKPDKCAEDPLIMVPWKTAGGYSVVVVALSTMRRDRSCASVANRGDVINFACHWDIKIQDHSTPIGNPSATRLGRAWGQAKKNT